MFIHLFRYKIIQLFHSKTILLWVFVFPLMLGTLFYMGFGNLLTNNDEKMKPIPLAVVSRQTENHTLTEVVKNLSKKSENQLFHSTWTNESRAQKLLHNNKVDGILYIQDTPSLSIQENGLNQSILNTFLTEYMSQSAALQQIGREHPDKLPLAITRMMADTSYNQDISITDSENGALIQYFYALIAMVCLYGSILGHQTSLSLQPHLSSLGARKNAAPVHKLSMILIEFAACLIVNYLSVLLLLFYLTVILKIDFGSHIPKILLTSFVGSVIGVSFGTFIGSIGKWKESTKEGFSMGIIMLCCFLGGLMVNNMPVIVENFAPWINRINPANLISDSFYQLSIRNNMTQYTTDLILMLLIAAIFCFGSYLLLRRKTAN